MRFELRPYNPNVVCYHYTMFSIVPISGFEPEEPCVWDKYVCQFHHIGSTGVVGFEPTSTVLETIILAIELYLYILFSTDGGTWTRKALSRGSLNPMCLPISPHLRIFYILVEIKAVTEGFEPSLQIFLQSCLAGKRHQPLGPCYHFIKLAGRDSNPRSRSNRFTVCLIWPLAYLPILII